MTVAYDRPGSRCLGVQPGTKALRDECLSLFAGPYDLGIYNCRSVRGGSSPSVHSEGRAWDAGFRQPGKGLRNPAGDPLANFLVAQHDLLSVQAVIWAKRIWSVTKPYWRTYTGSNPHLDHVHVEHNWHGAKKCTRAAVRLAYGRWSGVPQQENDDMAAVKLVKTQGNFKNPEAHKVVFRVHDSFKAWVVNEPHANYLGYDLSKIETVPPNASVLTLPTVGARPPGWPESGPPEAA